MDYRFCDAAIPSSLVQEMQFPSQQFDWIGDIRDALLPRNSAWHLLTIFPAADPFFAQSNKS